jgi:TonB-dependent receptor
MSPVRFKRCLLASAITLLSSSFVQAQNNGLEEVLVTGVRATVIQSLEQKEQSQQITDSISAEDLGKFPDLNLSESLQRIPGVTINRNVNGEGEGINVRGLGPQFTRVEINGVTAPSNGSSGRLGQNGGGRGFNFELLPAELFTNATVAKSSSAAQSEGGLAGVVTLETPKPLDYSGFKLSTSVQGNYNDVVQDVDPRAFITLSNNVDDVFGVSAAIAYSDSSFRSDGAENGVWRSLDTLTENSPAEYQPAYNNTSGDALVANGTRRYTFLEDRESLAGTFSVQYRPSDNLEVSLNSIYAELSSDKVAHRNDIPLENKDVQPDYDSLVIDDGVVVAGSFNNVQHRVGPRITDIDDEMLQVSVDAKWTPNDNWTVTPYLGYSNRDTDRAMDLLSFRANTETGAIAPGVLSYQRRGDYVDFSSSLTDFVTDPEDYSLNVLIFRPTVDEDEELTAKLDFERSFDVGSLQNVKFGVRSSDRTKTVNAQDYRLSRVSGANQNLGPTLADVITYLDVDVDGADPSFSSQMYSVNPDTYQDVFFVGGEVSPTASSNYPELSFVENRPKSAASNSYEVNEDTQNAYIEGDFLAGPATLNVGLRLVHTEQKVEGSIVNASGQIEGVAKSSSYTEYLPSASLRYELQEDLIFRATYSTTLTRPNLPDLRPSETIFAPDANSATGTLGNSELKPFTSDNFDVGLEWYFEEEGLLAVNVFYKDLAGLIDTKTITETRDFTTQLGEEVINGDVLFTQAENGASASIEGLEFSVQKRFNFLPQQWMQNIGGIFNYTYADSEADFGIENDVRSSGLPGLSRNSFNASLYYDDGNLDARISYAWRERYLAQTSDDFGLPRFIDDYGQLDLSANYQITDSLQAQLQFLNLTDENLVATTYNQDAGYLPYGVTDLNRRVIVGVRYSF